jgi:choline-glycine betaine transporter
MPSSWNNFYDSSKDRRYAALFWSTLMSLIGLLVLAASGFAVLSGLGMQDYFLEALPALAILFLVWGILRFRRAYLQNREKLPRGPISRDELRVARSKLRNGMRPIQRPAPRAPDTNLKY